MTSNIAYTGVKKSHTRAHAHTHTHARARAHTHAHSRTHARAHTHTCSQARNYIYGNIQIQRNIEILSTTFENCVKTLTPVANKYQKIKIKHLFLSIHKLMSATCLLSYHSQPSYTLPNTTQHFKILLTLLCECVSLW